MHASVKVLDIDIDMMTNDVFVQKMNEYLSDDKLDVILFASTELLDKAMGEESYREVIEQADLILPGEEALLSAHHVEVLEAGGMVVSCKKLWHYVRKSSEKRSKRIYNRKEQHGSRTIGNLVQTYAARASIIRKCCV